MQNNFVSFYWLSLKFVCKSTIKSIQNNEKLNYFAFFCRSAIACANGKGCNFR